LEVRVSADTVIIIYWWLFTAAVVLGAVGTVALRSLYHAALSLVVCLGGVAGYYVLLNAEFLAAAQIIIYIGAIMVLIISAILVSENVMGRQIVMVNRLVWPALVASGALFCIMVYANMRTVYAFNPEGPWLDSNVRQIGWSLMATYTLPFEVASLLLFMAMMGAIIISRRDRPGD
jgi:NADH:ubiquinone oxidoreductase subunit 6 (subunit J)